jgi:hypothetical protein
MEFAARCGGDYQFRVRTRAEQPEGDKGSWPNQRYRGVWSEPVTITVGGDSNPVFAPLPEGAMRLYLPMLAVTNGC